MYHLTEEGLADLADFTLSITGGAFNGRCSRFGTGTATMGTGLLAIELDILLHTENSLLEGQVHLHLQVAAAAW